MNIKEHTNKYSNKLFVCTLHAVQLFDVSKYMETHHIIVTITVHVSSATVWGLR